VGSLIKYFTSTGIPISFASALSLLFFFLFRLISFHLFSHPTGTGESGYWMISAPPLSFERTLLVPFL